MFTHTKKLLKRAMAMLLCAMLFLGALPADVLPRASAASWADSYMNRLKEYGVMVGGRPDDKITRAEMAAVLNRAFGFRRTGPIPFTDVHSSAWYYNDIVVSYNEGILSGTSRTTASPKANVTREQALALLGRCLRYDEDPGEVTDFTDGKNFSNWSSIYVRSALLAGIINSSGSFRPKSSATRGEIAVMLSTAIGELVNSSGVTELGGVFGNVTVNCPNVTLRNTTIAGDLYLTGGVGLGNVILDNVKVLGRIIVAGGGEGESGEASVLLNNVTARQLVVDPATGQYVSLRALGNTDIPETLVRSNAYIQDDVRNNNMGLRKVIFEEPSEGRFTIAGNMKDVTLKSPESLLIVGDTGTGSVTRITVDEAAVNARVDLEINASVDDIKLDTSSTITGTGDIGHIDVGASGCTSEILPDTVTVRPGVITEIDGITGIDSEKAKELSENPRLLEGYPKAKNIAPTSADAYFSTNKPGTLYWALTNAAKGPLTDADADDLVEQPDYGSGFTAKGTIDIDSSKKEFMVQLTGLTQGGRYYVSAVLVDAHGRRSPVKSQRIETPDGTVPAMASKDYPSITDATPTRNDDNAALDFSEIANLQATVMANKSCDLYYVLLASGSSAPSTGELLSAAFPNPYGYGRLHLIKNTLDSFRITEIDLNLDGTPDGLGEVKEKTSYDMYYWLTDANGEQSSQVQKITVTTKDVTPPKFTMGEMFQTDTKATSVTLSNTVDEDSTVYWVAVPSGDPYPKHDPEVYPNTDPWREFLKDEAAKIQVANGAGASSSKGKSGKLTAKANTQFSITISGLERESAYDVYYLAQDQANNYSQVIGMYTAHTLDETPPSAELRFESFPAESPDTPYAYSTIDVVFSEAIRYRQPSSASEPYSELRIMELYNKYKNAAPADRPKAEEEYVGALKDTIILCDSSGRAVTVRDWDQQSDRTDWVVDYRNVQVHQDGTKMVVSFVNDPSSLSKSALNLESGAQYYFRLQNIADDSQSRNPMGDRDMDAFTTVSARVGIKKLNDLDLNAFKIKDGEISDEPVYVYNDINTKLESTKTDKISADIAFTAEPRSTGTSADGVKWDMIFWFDRDVEFMLFTRIHGSGDKWVPVGVNKDGDPGTLKITVPATAKNYAGTSVIKNLTSDGTSVSIPQYKDINEPYKTGMLDGGLNDADGNAYDFALFFTKVGDRTDRSSFDQLINGQVTFVTGGAASLRDFQAANVDAYNSLRAGNTLITDITWPNKDSDLTNPNTRLLTKQFTDGREPVLISSYPRFTPTASGVTAKFALNNPGTIYYVLAPKTAGDNFVVTPQRNGANGRAENIPYQEIVDMIPECDINGPIGHQYTMTSDLSIMERMFPDHFTIPATDADGKETRVPNPAMAGYKFDSPITTNITNVEFSDVASEDLVSDSLPATKAEKTFNISGLRPNTEYLMYIVTTTGNSDIYSPVTVYRFTTQPVVKPIVTTQATGAQATINTDQSGTNLVYRLIPNDSTMNQLYKDPFYNSADPDRLLPSFSSIINSSTGISTGSGGYLKYGDAGFTVLHALTTNITVNGKRMSVFDVYAGEKLKQQIADLIDGTVADGATSLGQKEDTINDTVRFMCDDVWPDMGNSEYCLVVYGYCGPKDGGSDKSFSASRPIIKRKEQIQVTIGNGFDYDPVTKTIGGTLSFEFTDALHFFNTATRERIPLYNTPIVSGTPTGDSSQSIQNYLTVSKAVANNVEFVGASANNQGQELYSVTLDFSNVTASSFTVTLNGTFSGKTSEERTDALTLRVRVNTSTQRVDVSATTGQSWLKTPIVN